jgi:two-component system chemotaxis response regulator CheY
MAYAASEERLPEAPGAAAAFQLRDEGRRGSQGAKGVSVLGGSRRILVVDDDECMRELVRLHLANAGYEVEMAEDAVVALKSIMRRAPSLVIVDVNMPYLNGLDFVGALKADPGFRHIPVMFLTARTDVDQRALELGAAACLKKPLLAPALVAAVAAVVPGDTIVIG